MELLAGSGGGAGKRTAIMLLADAGNRPGSRDNTSYYLTAIPRLARSPRGSPLFSLTLELARSPVPGETSILPLVRRGWLALTLTHGLSEENRAALDTSRGHVCRALFARALRLEIRDGGAVVASTDVAGAEAPIALSAVLERKAAVGVLAALDGGASGLTVTTSLSYRTAPTMNRLRLEGRYAEIHHALERRIRRDGLIERDDVREALGEMLRDRVLNASLVDRDDVPPRRWTDIDTLLPRFVSAISFILESRDEGLYSLRQRPHPAMRLDLTETVESAAEGSWSSVAKFEDVAGGALEGFNRDEYLHLNAAGEDGGPVRVPRLVRSRRSPRSASRGTADAAMRLASRPGGFASLALTMTPDRRRAPSAHALLATDLVRAEIRGSHLVGLADDVVVEYFGTDQQPRPLPLPVVEQPDGPLWADRVNAGEYWYAPVWKPVLPAPGDDPVVSPYLFTFQPSGVTGGAVPTVGLDGTVRLTLRQAMSEATQARLEELAHPTARPVPVGNLSVSLEIPFRDEETGEVRRQVFAADAVQEGDTITATVALLNQWVRLCYGALAYPGFQDEPARLRVAFAFRAYTPLRDQRLELAFGGKIALTEIAAARVPERVSHPVFEPARMAFHLPHGVLRLAREAPLRGRPLPGAVALASSTVAFTPVTAVVARPELAIAAVAAELPEVRYGMRSVVSDENVDVLYPCSTLGAFYRQVEDGEETAIGCRDTLRLGEAVHKQFEELTDLRDPMFKVYRSLQQPGRFLVVPSAYRITRFAATEPADRAWRPAIMVYALLGNGPSENRYFLRATLEADVPPFARHLLEEKLQPLVPHAGSLVIDYPTDPTLQNPEAPTVFRWALPEGFDAPEVLQTWDGFQVSLSAGLANALAVTTLIESDGLVGDATFTLPDGSALTTALVLDTGVIGPWESGPVSVRLTGENANLENHTEREMNVFDLAVAGTDGATRRIPVELSLQPGAKADVALDAPAALGWASSKAAGGKVPLRQMNIFVEDVITNVIFVNLINYDNHQLASLKVKARLRETPPEYVLDLDENATGEITMTLPLTTYLENQVLEYQVAKAFTDDQDPEETPWKEWDLTVSNVISLTWELIE